MNGRMWGFVVGGLAMLTGVAGNAQDLDARTLVETSLRAMGGENMTSIRYSASDGYIGAWGQNYSPANDWPSNQLTRYTRTIDYEARSSQEAFTVVQGTGEGGPLGGGNAPLVTTPLEGEQQRSFMVSGDYAWDLEGDTVVPAPAEAEQRQLEIWLTPHGCLKAALAPGANPIAVTRNEQGKGRIRAVSFMALGKYRVQCAIDDDNLVERIQTYFPNPVVGDLFYEVVLTGYRDFGGVMFPTTFHAHHDLDDDLEGEGVNVSGGHNSFGITVSDVQVNVADATLTVPEAAREATVPPVRVESQQVADGVWYLGGGSHASVAVEFDDFITVVEAPLNEARSLAVIAEIKRLMPGKPIRYLVSTHHHWDSLGGLRAYVHQENVTIVMHQSNHAYYAEVLWIRPWVLEPDRLALFPPEEVAEGYTFEAVGRKYVLTDGTKVMEMHHVRGLAHAQGMLMAYLPAEQIVIEADLFTPPAPGAPLPTTVTPASRTFYDNVQGLGLDVTTIVPILGGRVFPWADFASWVEGAGAD